MDASIYKCCKCLTVSSNIGTGQITSGFVFRNTYSGVVVINFDAIQPMEIVAIEMNSGVTSFEGAPSGDLQAPLSDFTFAWLATGEKPTDAITTSGINPSGQTRFYLAGNQTSCINFTSKEFVRNCTKLELVQLSGNFYPYDYYQGSVVSINANIGWTMNIYYK